MSKHQSDLPAALMGLVVGALALLGVMFTVVQLVNAKHGKAEAGHVAHN